MPDVPAEPDPRSTPPEPDGRALRRLLLFQFVVLSGLFAFAVPGLFVMGGAEALPTLYGPALAIHAFCLWRLVRFDPAVRPWVLGSALVVVGTPWCTWALREWFGLPWLMTGPVLFAGFVLFAVRLATRRPDTPAD